MDMAFELFRYSYYVRSLLAAPLTNIGFYLGKTDQINPKKKFFLLRTRPFIWSDTRLPGRQLSFYEKEYQQLDLIN